MEKNARPLRSSIAVNGDVEYLQSTYPYGILGPGGSIESRFTNPFPARRRFSSLCLFMFVLHQEDICLMPQHRRICVCVSYWDATLYIIKLDRVLGACEWYKLFYLGTSCHAWFYLVQRQRTCPARMRSGQRLWFVGFCAAVGIAYLLHTY